ncbi:CsxC family protein [Heyndrickxia acidicola]|nr:Uracil permease [Heyndrickxia acidicola]
MSFQPNQPGPCPVTSTQQGNLTNLGTTLNTTAVTTPTIKVPVVLAEPTLEINVEADITLSPAATEIKRVKKNVFLNQVKLIPTGFARIATTSDYFRVTTAKLFVAGHIRKNIEYATASCNAPLQDQIADVPFTGATTLTFAAGAAAPIIGISEMAESNFLNDTTQMDARLDKYFFQNLVKYNEQPYGELVAANFFELDFSPTLTDPEAAFSTLREKIVLDLTVKVIQVQQLQIPTANVVTPILTGLTPPVSP